MIELFMTLSCYNVVTKRISVTRWSCCDCVTIMLWLCDDAVMVVWWSDMLWMCDDCVMVVWWSVYNRVMINIVWWLRYDSVIINLSRHDHDKYYNNDSMKNYQHIHNLYVCGLAMSNDGYQKCFGKNWCRLIWFWYSIHC